MFLLGPHGLADVEGKIGVVGGSISAGTGIAAKSRGQARHVFGIFTDAAGRAAERFSNQDTNIVVSKVATTASWRETVSLLSMRSLK